MAEYKRISEQLELPLKLNNTKSLLQVSGSGGIIKETKKKPITLITDKAIDSVPLLKVDGFTEEQNILFQVRNKELLRYAKERNDSKEVAFILDENLNILGRFIGEDDEVELDNIHGKNLFLMHNHPRNSSYSNRDLITFIEDSAFVGVGITKNNSGVEIVIKSVNYNKEKAKTMLLRQIQKNVKMGTDNEIDKAIKAFLTNNKEMLKWQKKG